MDDLDLLLADLGRPKSGLKTTTAPTSSTQTRALEPNNSNNNSRINLNEIEALMGDLQTTETKPTTTSSGNNNALSSSKGIQQQAFDTSDDLDELMASLNSSISNAIQQTNIQAQSSNPVNSNSNVQPAAASVSTTTAPVKQQQQQPSYTSTATPTTNNNGAVKFTSTASVAKKPVQVSRAVLETTTPQAPKPQHVSTASVSTTTTATPAPASNKQPSLSTEDLDELLKNLNPQTPVVNVVQQTHAIPSIAPSHGTAGTLSNSGTFNRNNSSGGITSSPSQSHQHHHHHHNHQHNNNNNNNSNVTPAPKNKVVQGDDLDSLLNNLTSQMKDIDSTGPTSRGTCGSCRKPILGETIQAMGKLYHPEHFLCHNCQSPIGTRNFYEQEGVPHCEKCYQELFCARCAHCDDPITDRCITALGKKWHVHHFVCTQCLKPFEGGNFFERDGRPYCEADFYSTFAARCGGCNQPIRGECINALGTQWHPEHFVCQYCQKSFASGTFFEFGGKPYCDIHYHQQAGSVCSGCGKAVSGRCVDALDKKWHPEHFVCAFCMNPLAGGSYTANNGKPYCKVCHSKLFGN